MDKSRDRSGKEREILNQERIIYPHVDHNLHWTNHRILQKVQRKDSTYGIYDRNIRPALFSLLDLMMMETAPLTPHTIRTKDRNNNGQMGKGVKKSGTYCPSPTHPFLRVRRKYKNQHHSCDTLREHGSTRPFFFCMKEKRPANQRVTCRPLQRLLSRLRTRPKGEERERTEKESKLPASPVNYSLFSFPVRVLIPEQVEHEQALFFSAVREQT
jgi:hypothetical protein